MEQVDLEALKNNQEFLDNLGKLEEECKKEESIAKGYQLLDAKFLLEQDEEEINELFSFIVNNAFDRLSQKVANKEGFKTANTEELATVRAVYEFGIQKYSENDKKGAKEIFLVLSHTVDNQELKDAMMVHAVCVMAGHSFDDFTENIVDVTGVDEYSEFAFFIQNFTQPTEILLTMYAKYVQEAKEILGKIS